MKVKNIIIYIVDCLRPDYLGCYGFDKPTSPNIDQLAKDGVIFKKVYTTGTGTKPISIPLVTGFHPSCLDSQGPSLAFGGYENLLQKIVGKKGFKSYVFSNNPYFTKAFGFTEGFDEEIELDLLEKLYRENPSNKEIINKIHWQLSAIIPSQYLHEIFYKRFNPLDKNFVVFWSLDPHSPYCVRGNKSYFGNKLSDYFEGEDYFLKDNKLATRIQKFLRLLLFNLFGFYNKKRIEKIKSLYCDAIRYNDERVGELISYLKEKGEWEDTLFILFGDHGDAFIEHGEYGHCSAPYNEVVSVPLIVKFPGQKYAGKEVKDNVSLIDIYPTILELLEVKGSPQDIDGYSLLDCLEKRPKKEERKILIESFYKTDLYTAVLIKGSQKYFKMEPRGNWSRKAFRKISAFPHWFSEKEFDLKKDPKEQKGSKKVSLQLKNDFAEMKSIYQARQEKYKSYKKEMVASAKILERFKNLGYF
ncbi:MAG: sulfatase [Candidatus Nealsonbacteria bacterium]